jgi:tight adherence protein C
MELIAPIMIFAVIFGGALLLLPRRSNQVVAQIGRHEIAIADTEIAMAQAKTAILGDVSRAGIFGGLAEKVTRERVKSKSATLLLEAGSPMPVARFLFLRFVMTFVMLPLFIALMVTRLGLTPLSILMMLMALMLLPNALPVAMKRRARKRANAIEMAMPDAMDLLVVCVEGGLSLDGSLQQVAQRTDGVLATELRRLLSEITTGLGRREAFLGLVERSRAQSLAIFATAIVQADKMGTSLGSTLRTLAETMRTRRRQAAETQARKAPIKMLPFLVIFMIPSLFIVILGPVVLAIIEYFGKANG